jgi:hypothetical protein
VRALLQKSNIETRNAERRQAWALRQPVLHCVAKPTAFVVLAGKEDGKHGRNARSARFTEGFLPANLRLRPDMWTAVRQMGVGDSLRAWRQKAEDEKRKGERPYWMDLLMFSKPKPSSQSRTLSQQFLQSEPHHGKSFLSTGTKQASSKRLPVS